MERLELANLFDAIVDGNMVSRAKPNPEVFALGGQLLGAVPEECIVFEDAVAGIQAAHNAGMTAVGIGTPEVLPDADLHLPGLDSVTIEAVERALS